MNPRGHGSGSLVSMPRSLAHSSLQIFTDSQSMGESILKYHTLGRFKQQAQFLTAQLPTDLGIWWAVASYFIDGVCYHMTEGERKLQGLMMRC